MYISDKEVLKNEWHVGDRSLFKCKGGGLAVAILIHHPNFGYPPTHPNKMLI